MRWYQRFFPRAVTERQLDAELQFHLDQRIADLVATGMTWEEARRRAQLQFGGREECRDVGAAHFLETLAQDLRYGLRMLARNPGFTAVAILTLALGIGANTAIFSAINAVMLKSLPVKEPSQLVLLKWFAPNEATFPFRNISGWTGCPHSHGIDNGCSFSYPDLERFRELQQPFVGVIGFAGPMRVTFAVDGKASLATGEFVTSEFFSTLGVRPILGRELNLQDDMPTGPPVAVISFDYWNARFRKDPSVIGRAITINTHAFTIVGVAPPEFFGLQAGSPNNFWMPLAQNRELHLGSDTFTDPRTAWVQILGRLKPGVTLEQAQAAATLAFRQGLTAAAKSKSKDLPWIRLAPASRGLYELRDAYSKPLFILMCVVGLVLLIACANMANLLLARGAARRREVAMRLALGAGRGRLVRQFLTESMLLAAMGGAAGLLLAYWGASLLQQFIALGGDESLALDVRPDLTVFAFTAALCFLTGLLFGIAPAFRGTRVDVTPTLKGGVLSWRGAKGRLRWGAGKFLVALQAGLSFALLIGAGLFVRTLVNLESEHLGFNQGHLLLFSLNPWMSGYDKTRSASLYQTLLERIQVLPGVVSTTYSDRALIGEGFYSDDLNLAGQKVEDVRFLCVGPRFFETMQIPIMLGRALGSQDTAAAPKVAVINEALARRISGRPNPVGLRFRASSDPKPPEIEIVGIAASAKYDEVREGPPATLYVPYSQSERGRVTFEVRSSGNPKNLIPSVRRLASEFAKDVPLSDVKTQEERIAQTLLQERLFAKLSSFFGLLALLLASTGLYGLMSYAVARRTGEIGIRMALGAERGDVLWMVLRESLVLVLVGLALGLPVAGGASRFVSSMLYGLKPHDPAAIIGATLIMVGVAATAAYLPARRASRVEPVVALRYE